MDTTHWRRIEKAFDELVELPPADRDARLTFLAADDDEFRAEVERLLAADSREPSGILDDGLEPLAGSLFGDDLEVGPGETSTANQQIDP